MLSWIREKFGKTVIGAIVALLALVFVFYGVFTPKGSRGMGDGAVAGTVNGEPITLSDFNRAYNRQVEFFKNMLGGKVNEDQLKNFHIRENVWRELVRRKMMVQEAEKDGYLPSDEEIRDRISEIPAFQENGKFSLEQYKRVLQANNYTPAGFEKMLREDAATEKWQDYFRDRVNVSEDEIKQQFLATADKRNIKYVLLTNDVGKKEVHVDPAEVQKYLKDPAKLNLIRSQYEGRKAKDYKGKSFEAVKDQIARDLIASTNLDAIRGANNAIASRVAAIMTASKGSDAAVDRILKPYGVQVKSTGLIGRDTQFIPGLGQAKDLLADAFAQNSPINGKVKTYSVNNWAVVAVISESQTADLAKLPAQHDDLAKQILSRKERDMYDAWLRKVGEKAKIEGNPAVIGGKEES